MQIASMHFKERAHEKLHDAQVQRSLKKFQDKFVVTRRRAIVELDDFEATREAARAIRQRVLDDLDTWLELFERNATARGATVLWAETPADINRLVLDIAARHGVAKIIKSKSMVSEESALNHAIEAAGYTLLHGEAVAVGMRGAARLGLLAGTLDEAGVARLDALLDRFGLPQKAEVDPDGVLALIGSDKKRAAGRQRWVLPLTGGGVRIRDDVPESLVRSALLEIVRG